MLGFVEAEEEETRNQNRKDCYIIILGLLIHYKVSNNYVNTGTL